MAKISKAAMAAVAMALHEWAGHNVHDTEPNVITIKGRSSLWNAKFISMTQRPTRK